MLATLALLTVLRHPNGWTVDGQTASHGEPRSGCCFSPGAIAATTVSTVQYCDVQ